MGTTDDDSGNTFLQHWLARFQGLDMTLEQIAEPAKTAAAFAQTIGEQAEGLNFDTDPAAFNKLLHDLAPEEVKTGGDAK